MLGIDRGRQLHICVEGLHWAQWMVLTATLKGRNFLRRKYVFCMFIHGNELGVGAIVTDSERGAKRRQFRCRNLAASSDTLSPIAKAFKNMVFRRRFNRDALSELKRGVLRECHTYSNDRCSSSWLRGGFKRKARSKNARSSSGSKVNPVMSSKGTLIAC